MKRRTGIWFKPLLVGLLFVTLALSGCEGDDGSNGTPGASAYEIAVANGFTGTEAEWLAMISGNATATTADIETCAVCHASVEAIHAATGVETVSNVVLTPSGANLVVTFNVKVDGVNNDAYRLRRAYVHFDNPALKVANPALITSFVRTDIAVAATATVTTPATLVANGVGNYTLTIPANSGNPTPASSIIYVQPNSTYLFQLTQGLTVNDSRPVVVVQNGTAPLRDLVTNEGCANCHGPYPAWSEKFQHYAVGGSECQICHSQATRSTGFIAKDAAGVPFVQFLAPDGSDTNTDPDDPIFGTNLTEYIHGIHNSHNMPDGTYYRTTALDGASNIEDRYSIGFPSNMRNCSVCHSDPAQFADVADEPVSYYLCMTCHNNWDGFVHISADVAVPPTYAAGDKIFAADNFHRAYTPTTPCMDCHGTTTLLDEVSDFHNSFSGSEDSFYRGEDISFANNDDVTFAITGVTSNGSAVSFTWTASKLGAAVNPCNTDIATGPTYQSLGAYLSYAKGDDWVNEFVSTSPGQPAGARNLFGTGGTATNPNPVSTTCAGNVATTTGLTLNAGALAYADKVLLAIGGKPKDRHAPTGNDYLVREPSPTYAFNPATGTPATARRNAVDNDKCLGCHQGTLYQHGGDRVDNEQLCVVCHNPSAADKNNRLDRFQIVNADGTVNTGATYDGKNNETYDMRVMIHAIHGVDKRDKPWVVYRSRGIYAFVPARFEDIILPGDTETSTVEVPYPFPAGWPADGQTINGSTNASKITHNWTVVHYPKPTSDCAACHNDEAYEAPDQTKAVALTVDPGTDYADQSDDIVIGPTAAACTACHATAPTMIHATSDFGYKANVTKESMLEKAAQ